MTILKFVPVLIARKKIQVPFLKQDHEIVQLSEYREQREREYEESRSSKSCYYCGSKKGNLDYDFKLLGLSKRNGPWCDQSCATHYVEDSLSQFSEEKHHILDDMI